MTTNNEIIISKEQNVLVIPRAALFLTVPNICLPERIWGVSMRKVECGNQNEKFVVIKSGLKEGIRYC